MKKLFFILFFFLITNFFEYGYCSNKVDINKINILLGESLSKEYCASLLNKSTRYPHKRHPGQKTLYKFDNISILHSHEKEHLIYSYFVLSYLNKYEILNIPKVYGVFQYENDFYSILTFKEGDSLVDINLKLNEKHLQKIFSTLLKFEAVLFFHDDLSFSNVIFVKNDDVNIIDFDSFYIVTKDGSVLFDFINDYEQLLGPVNAKYLSLFSRNRKKKYLYNREKKLFHIDSCILKIPSNIILFEQTFLSEYILNYENKDYAMSLFKKYLVLKSSYYSQKASIYNEFLSGFQSIDSRIMKKHNALINSYIVISEMLAKQDDDVFNIELSKLNILHYLYNKRNSTNFYKNYKKLLKEYKHNVIKLKKKSNDKILQQYVNINIDLYNYFDSFSEVQILHL